MKSNGPSKDRLIVVGVISGAHGVRGDVRVKSFTEIPDDLFSYGPLLSEKGDVVLEPLSERPGKDHFIVKPKRPRQKEEWDALKGTLLHVRRSALPPPEDDEFYIEDLIGLKAVDLSGNAIGTVKAVQDFGAGDLMEVLPLEQGHPSYYVPFTLDDVPGVHFDTGEVVVRDPGHWADQSDPRESDED